MAILTNVEKEKLLKVDVREATVAAMNYFRTLFPDGSNFSLEEVELSEDEKYWLITLGVDVIKTGGKGLVGVQEFLSPPKTKYKVFKIDRKTGQVLAMKIRSIG